MNVATAIQDARRGAPPMDFLDARLELFPSGVSHRREADREREK